jgi:autotransporter family porin
VTIKRIFLTTAGLYLAIPPAMAASAISNQPEVGAYLGNQFAASTLFTQTLHQRKIAPGDGQFWMRASGYHTKNLSTADGDLPIDMDRQVVMLGGDLLSLEGGNQEWTMGLMTGYGHAKSSAKNAVTSSDGEVNGYSVGAYSTWYQDAKNHSGAYVDSWLQYAWFNNSVTHSQAKQRYDSSRFSVSLEAGYAFQPFSTRELIIEPQLQVIYSKFDTDNYFDTAGVYIHKGDTPDFTSRVGIRWYSDQDDNTTAYLATNWWHNNGSNSVYFNNTRAETNSLDNLFEVKVGIQSPSSYSLQLWFEGGTTMGTNSYQDYGASIGLSYRW